VQRLDESPENEMDWEIFCHPEVALKNFRSQVDYKKSHPKWTSEIEDQLSLALIKKLRVIAKDLGVVAILIFIRLHLA